MDSVMILYCYCCAIIIEQELEATRKKQRLKVEELKQKMKYYQAKTLIERYEGHGANGDRNAAQSSTNAPERREVATPLIEP